MSQTRFFKAVGLSFVIALVLVCVAGVLILPQVDLPDFIVRPGQTSVTGQAFTFTAFVSVLKSFANPVGFSQNPHFGIDAFGQFDPSEVLSAHSVLAQLCTHRC